MTTISVLNNMKIKIEQISDLIKSSPTLTESSVVSVLNLIKLKKIIVEAAPLKSLSHCMSPLQISVSS